MWICSILDSVAAVVLFSAVTSAFSATGNSNVVYYWGQNSAGGQQPLSYYCQSADSDVLVLSFLYNFFDTGGYPSLNFGGGACSSGQTLPGTSLLRCPDIEQDIKQCQSLGKKVLLSLGGAIGNYGFQSDAQGEQFADTLWNLFGAGQSPVGRPFGSATIDGFDLDIENHLQTGYVAFAKKLRQHFASDSSKQYFLSAAPQCPFPDASVGQALAGAPFDMIFVQFYNNYCGLQTWKPGPLDGSGFNFDQWDTFVKNSPNPNAKIYLGVAGGPTAAGSGYESPQLVGQIANSLQKQYNTFGGVMVWDASQAWANHQDGPFPDIIKNALKAGSSEGNQPPLLNGPNPVLSQAPPAISSPSPKSLATSSIPQAAVSPTSSLASTPTISGNPAWASPPSWTEAPSWRPYSYKPIL